MSKRTPLVCQQLENISRQALPYSVDPFLLAAKMTADAVLAYRTAFEFYGKAHSVHESFLYLTYTFLRPLTFRGYHFRGVKFPKS
jgi:hypothetical protein